MKLRRVAIVFGVHGNEFTGTYLGRRWRRIPSEISRPSFETSLFFGNPKAFEINRRFVDEDLNRSFLRNSLASLEERSYEANRAKVLNAALGPKGDSQFDFLVDLHTTTASGGTMLVLIDDCPFNLCLAAFLASQLPDARIYYIPPGNSEQAYIVSLNPHALTVEVGPIPQGVLRYDVFEKTNRVVQLTLDFIHAQNIGKPVAVPRSIELFVHRESVLFPTDEAGEISGIVHEGLQDRDFEPLHPGQPIFRTLTGEVLPYTGSETRYPVFVNEAAYYGQRVAFSLASKEVREVLPLDACSTRAPQA